jgi:hypothetical protein
MDKTAYYLGITTSVDWMSVTSSLQFVQFHNAYKGCLYNCFSHVYFLEVFKFPFLAYTPNILWISQWIHLNFPPFLVSRTVLKAVLGLCGTTFTRSARVQKTRYHGDTEPSHPHCRRWRRSRDQKWRKGSSEVILDHLRFRIPGRRHKLTGAEAGGWMHIHTLGFNDKCSSLKLSMPRIWLIYTPMMIK